MLSRRVGAGAGVGAARLLTGPLGFFLAGAIDVTAAWGGYALGRLRARLSGR